MSRIGKLPVEIPAGVNVSVDGQSISVKGPKGELSRTLPSIIDISVEDGAVVLKRSSEEKFHKSMHGTARALINNMVVGVSEGYVRELSVEGVGYRAEMSGKTLVLYVGYSHEVPMEPPEGVSFEVENRGREIKVSGYDKEVVGQTAALIRGVRPPEPYKGKGIRYKGEHVRRKAGKAGKAK